MKIIGKNGWDVIVQLSWAEWTAIGGAADRDGYGRIQGVDITKDPPKLKELVESLESIKKACPDLQRIRASLQAFLLLTEPEAIQQVLDSCGVASEVVEPSESEVNL